jgi:osmotically-inducible protein OsmY
MKKFIWAALLAASLPAIHGCAAVVVGGAATGVMMADDRRKTGVYLEDEEIELRAMDRLRGQFPEKTVSVSVTSFNHQVLLTGQVPDQETKTRVQEAIRVIPNVAKVYDETTVSGVTSLTSETNDASITTKVKARFVSSDKVASNHVKVVTEASVVYLMGLVTKEEGEEAAQIAASTKGATRVVKVFEYLN